MQLGLVRLGITELVSWAELPEPGSVLALTNLTRLLQGYHGDEESHHMPELLG